MYLERKFERKCASVGNEGKNGSSNGNNIVIADSKSRLCIRIIVIEQKCWQKEHHGALTEVFIFK